MMLKTYFYCIIPFILYCKSQTLYQNNVSEYAHYVDRFDIIYSGTDDNLQTSFKPYQRRSVTNFLCLQNNTIDSTNRLVSTKDKFNSQYLIFDSWDHQNDSLGHSKKDILNFFYKRQNALYSNNTAGLKLIVNPVLGLSVGKDNSANTSGIFYNSRGAELRGFIDDKLGFYTYFTDNQAQLPQYLENSLQPIDSLKQVLMGENYIKVNNSTSKVDYISARGYVSFDLTKHIALQFGHDKNFVGNGFRSLILSENSGAYNFLKLQTKVWKIQYTNLFAQMTAIPTITDGYFAKKFFSLHHLSTNIGKNINIGLFESVCFGNRGNGFDLEYLNPIIFYRSVEQNLGSSDNALLGGDWKINFLKHFSIYGQVVIDEFLISNLKNRAGSWTNKQAIQIGGKYINVLGVKNLDGQIEFNSVRPYTYAHADNFRSYTNFLQPIAHPRGANFKELVGILRYQIFNRCLISSKLIYTKQGIDSLTSNTSVGSNILKDYSNRIKHNGQQDIGHFIGQGNLTTVIWADLSISYMLKHNLFIDLGLVYRNQKSSDKSFSLNSKIISLGLRLNFAKTKNDW